MENIRPCKKCGHLPVKFEMNFGSICINPFGDKPFSTDRWEAYFGCINPECGKNTDKAINKWNEAQK